MFVCTKCKNRLEDDQRAVGGYAQCRECRAAYVKAWREAHPGRNAALCQARKERDPERVKQEQLAYRSQPENAEKARERAREWYRENRERALLWAKANYPQQQPARKARHKERIVDDPAYLAQVRAQSRRATAKRRVPQGISKFFVAEIRGIYDRCPPGFEVDHIEPLIQKNACGLHAPWNLWYLTMRENRRKGNEVV